MPYFVYQVTGELPAGALTLLDSFDNYRDARALARTKRAEAPKRGPGAVRIVFSETAELAENLLRAPREEPILQEWEK